MLIIMELQILYKRELQVNTQLMNQQIIQPSKQDYSWRKKKSICSGM